MDKSKQGAIVGVSDHGDWAVLVTVARDGTLLDRRRVDLVDDALPNIPHHHEAQMPPVDEAAADSRGWAVKWYEAKQVLASGGKGVEIRRIVGPPWSADHKLAMAAAMAIARGR